MRFQIKKHKNFASVICGFWFIVFTLVIGLFFSGWQEMKKTGNESNALYFISSFRTKQNKYAAEHSDKFAKTFSEIVEYDKEFEDGKVIFSGYIFTLKVNDPTGEHPAFYSINADPQINYGLFQAGDRHFYFDSMLSTIKSTEENRQANADDSSM